jgi:hypothetical protein
LDLTVSVRFVLIYSPANGRYTPPTPVSIADNIALNGEWSETNQGQSGEPFPLKEEAKYIPMGLLDN